MNKAEKQVKAASLRNEATVIRQMRENFKEARANIEAKIKVLSKREQTKSVIWQRQYQEQLKKQLDEAIDVLSKKNYSSIREYLAGEYENGYIGTMYALQKSGLPMIMPIDQKAVAKMVETTGDNIKLSKKLWGNSTKLKNTVRREVSIGLASGESWEQVASRIGRAHDIDYNKTIRIARTEGHRVTESSGFDAAMEAKNAGADLVKQWDSTLDGATRPSHRKLDGEIRELDDKFSNGAVVPGQSGIAAEDINCRCACLFRPRWAVEGDDGYTKYSKLPEGMSREDWLSGKFDKEISKRGGKIVDLSDSKNFADFKRRYKNAAKNITAQNAAKATGVSTAGNAATSSAGKANEPFKPAATIEEAQDYANKYVSPYKSKYSGEASYKGIGLDYANKMNQVLKETFDDYDIEHLRNVKPMNMREKRWKNSTAEAAYQWLTGGDLFINPKYYKNAKAFKAHLDEANKLLKYVLDHADSMLAKKDLSAAKRKYLLALKKSGRQLVAQSTDDFAKACFTHEMGHALDDKIWHSIMKKDGFDVKASMEKYASKISGYAITDRQEYIAESYTAYKFGMKKLVDPYLVKLFERTKKKK